MGRWYNERMKKLEKIIKAFGNTSRLKILRYLKKNKFASVATISQATKCSYKATSKHLSILYHVDVVEREQVRYEMQYRLSNTINSAASAILKLV